MIVRRAFLAGLASVAAALPLTASGATGRLRGEVRLPPSYVTNLPAKLPGSSLGAGTQLRLRREPERRYDPSSVAVLGTDGTRLGYLPADQSRVLAPLLDAGLPARAEVLAAGAAPRPFLRLNLFLCMATPT